MPATWAMALEIFWRFWIIAGEFYWFPNKTSIMAYAIMGWIHLKASSISAYSPRTKSLALAEYIWPIQCISVFRLGMIPCWVISSSSFTYVHFLNGMMKSRLVIRMMAWSKLKFRESVNTRRTWEAPIRYSFYHDGELRWYLHYHPVLSGTLCVLMFSGCDPEWRLLLARELIRPAIVSETLQAAPKLTTGLCHRNDLCWMIWDALCTNRVSRIATRVPRGALSSFSISHMAK